MRAIEAVLAVLLTSGGIRSLWRWSRRGFTGQDLADHVLYALYVTGRVGLWFGFAGFFFIAASIETTGVAASEELASYRWYVLVPLVLATMQLIAGVFLGRRPGTED